ncbi:hypothetical protein GCM10010232_08650 [Streptomyces amakusaensis]|uniref:Secreted protein n=1 Tax=Streptomyces amakusaensis TaxID=67271 RepID=A0ABW0AVK0_9ACTN
MIAVVAVIAVTVRNRGPEENSPDDPPPALSLLAVVLAVAAVTALTGMLSPRAGTAARRRPPEGETPPTSPRRSGRTYE